MHGMNLTKTSSYSRRLPSEVQKPGSSSSSIVGIGTVNIDLGSGGEGDGGRQIRSR